MHIICTLCAQFQTVQASGTSNDSSRKEPPFYRLRLAGPELLFPDTEAGDRAIATAILGALLHHAMTLNTRGDAYRLKEKLKAGLGRPEQTEA